MELVELRPGHESFSLVKQSTLDDLAKLETRFHRFTDWRESLWMALKDSERPIVELPCKPGSHQSERIYTRAFMYWPPYCYVNLEENMKYTHWSVRATDIQSYEREYPRTVFWDWVKSEDLPEDFTISPLAETYHRAHVRLFRSMELNELYRAAMHYAICARLDEPTIDQVATLKINGRVYIMQGKAMTTRWKRDKVVWDYISSPGGPQPITVEVTS